jgi:membrane-associated phospholipid phosphatase
MGRLAAADRRLGRAVRERIGRRPRLDRAARVSGSVLAPVFELLIMALVAERPTRAAGLRAGASAVAGAAAAKALRDVIGRPRPGTRSEGGFPSRHAAAASAIARSVAHSNRYAGRALGAVAAIGLIGRVVSAEHDPADIVAGVIVGCTAAGAINAVSDHVATTTRCHARSRS